MPHEFDWTLGIQGAVCGLSKRVEAIPELVDDWMGLKRRLLNPDRFHDEDYARMVTLWEDAQNACLDVHQQLTTNPFLLRSVLVKKTELGCHNIASQLAQIWIWNQSRAHWRTLQDRDTARSVHVPLMIDHLEFVDKTRQSLIDATKNLFSDLWPEHPFSPL